MVYAEKQGLRKEMPFYVLGYLLWVLILSLFYGVSVVFIIPAYVGMTE